MNTLSQRAAGKYVTDEVYRMCVSYLTSAVEMSPPYLALKPHLDFVLFQVLLIDICVYTHSVTLHVYKTLYHLTPLHTHTYILIHR